MIPFVLTAAGLIGLLGIVRMLLAIHATYWYNERYEEIDALPTFDCQRFHEIQNRPKPIAVRVNDWLEIHHV